jgi:hypothetical protein
MQLSRVHRRQGPALTGWKRLGLWLPPIALLAWSSASHAQTTLAYFPSGVAGYDQQLGVTVVTRLRPLYDAPGIQLGGVVVRPTVDQSLFYNSNVNGSAGTGSWGSQTAAAVTTQSDWSRNSLSTSVGVDHYQYFAFPSESYTDWNIGLGGGYTIGDSNLDASYSHQSYHELGTTIGAVQSQTPVLDRTDTGQMDYTFNFGRFAVTPVVSASAYRFGTATVEGVQQNQQFLDRNVLAGAVVGSYSLNDEGSLLVVTRGVDSEYPNQLAGEPSNNSHSFAVLGGVDYQLKGLWRYQLLVGAEVRTFASSQFETRTAPIVEGTAIWTPTGVLTLTGTLSRSIEDPQSAGTNGYVLTQSGLVVDYELLRNVLLEGRGGVQYAQYLQGGSQLSGTFGGGATWLINRNMRLSLNYDRTQQSSVNDTATATPGVETETSGQYEQDLVALTLHIGF